MKNLDQIRAASALALAHSNQNLHGADGGEAIKKIPPMIANNGLLAAIAFSIEEKNDGFQRPGFAIIFNAIAKHLACDEINIIQSNQAKDLIQKLTESDSTTLKLATSEAMAWLSYARRFIKKSEGTPNT